MSLTVAEAIATRRATRQYSDQEVTNEVLDRVVAQALEAPTAFNAQRADLVVVRDQEVKDALFEASGQAQLRDAPVVFVAVARTDVPTDLKDILGDERGEWVENFFAGLDAAKLRESAIKDATLVAGFLLLAAQGEGLATSPTTGWDEELVLKAVGLPGGERHAVALVVAAGYPGEHPSHPGREANRRVNDRY
ncbi:nitroreductase family protein [Corynebacterium sp. 153RC1]|uniref:nitroreductase family protein n=1 Tax=Corynebacterium TaxID=1716 RepID=UPI00211C607F|nr:MULTISPECIES: nitroreductase family protein [unclassified Corynebacterium]MCQ9371678.1 nitroreductase family protein [Corynebacterium sp. 35RC1]MCQ9343506.1 nitroreductase family protein [Corynebacterium sp. 76QC2CO]MCQ9352820.1 nitroreductase family protein [Corynebacterium sp. 209RC1]MCQ9355212.1 nitroreductase family protein [Corynebacterium sp. 1222RC1]MCQ9357399.1 nitroreductase family protein [Corynebacterium sp. 122RC1]